MIGRDDLIAIGKFLKPHGVNGEIAATLEIEASLINRVRCLVACIDGIYVPFFVEAMRPKNHYSTLLTITGIHNENEAALLTNKELFVLKTDYDALATTPLDDDEEEADELPVDYFIGFDITLNNEVKGRVTDVDDTTINVLFVVETANGTSLLIPAVDEMIEEIDTEARFIAMNVPDELLTINTK